MSKNINFSELVRCVALREELFHALYLRVDAGRGSLPAVAPAQHLAGQGVAGVDHSGHLLDGTCSIRHAVRVVQAHS